MNDCMHISNLNATMALEPQCPLTGSSMAQRMTVPMDWRKPSDPRDWKIWWNEAADFGQIFPRPEPHEVESFYDIDTYYTHPDSAAPDAEAEARQVGIFGRCLSAIAFRFENGAEPTQAWWRSIIASSSRQALEIGCGDGDRMQTYGPFLDHVRGVEPDQRAVSVARERGLDVYEGTAEDLPDDIKDRQYDLIVFTHVLEHTIDPVLSLKNAAEMLTDDGLMSIEVPNNASAGARHMGQAWRWLDAPRHLNFFTPESLQACAEAAGLKVKAVLYRGYVRQFTPDWIVDEAQISAAMQGRAMTQKDVNRQLRHSAKLLATTALAHPSKKYDSVRILCTRA